MRCRANRYEHFRIVLYCMWLTNRTNFIDGIKDVDDEEKDEGHTRHHIHAWWDPCRVCVCVCVLHFVLFSLRRFDFMLILHIQHSYDRRHRMMCGQWWTISSVYSLCLGSHRWFECVSVSMCLLACVCDVRFGRFEWVVSNCQIPYPMPLLPLTHPPQRYPMPIQPFVPQTQLTNSISIQLNSARRVLCICSYVFDDGNCTKLNVFDRFRTTQTRNATDIRLSWLACVCVRNAELDTKCWIQNEGEANHTSFSFTFTEVPSFLFVCDASFCIIRRYSIKWLSNFINCIFRTINVVSTFIFSTHFSSLLVFLLFLLCRFGAVGVLLNNTWRPVWEIDFSCRSFLWGVS